MSAVAVADRRTFVRQAMVGLPVLAGAAFSHTPAFAFAGVGGVTGVGFDASHAGMERIVRDFAGFYNQAAARGIGANDLRAMAERLRTLAAYRRESGRDDQVAASIRGLIAQQGVDRLAAIEPDLSLLRVGPAYYGLRADAPRIEMPGRDAREMGLEVLSRMGAAPFYLDGYMLMEELQKQNPERSLCDVVQEMMRVMEAMAATTCVGAMFLPVFAPECFAASTVLAALKMIAFFMSC